MSDKEIITLEPSLAAWAAEQGELVRSFERFSVRCLVEIGFILCRVKQRLDHGGFGPWLAEYFGGSEDTAQNYMRLARWAEKDERVLNVRSLAVAYSWGDLPERTRKAIVEREAYSWRQAQDLIDEHRRDDWLAAVDASLLDGEIPFAERAGNALAAAEEALEDPVLRPAAVAFLEREAGTFARLADREPEEIKAEAGVTDEERRPEATDAPPGAQLMETEGYWICCWSGDKWEPIAPVLSFVQVWPSNAMIAAFPRTTDGPAAKAWQNSAVRAVCARLNARTVGDRAAEVVL
jgi:hypothetical protein